MRTRASYEVPGLAALTAATSPERNGFEAPWILVKYAGTVLWSGFVQTIDTAKVEGSMMNCMRCSKHVSRSTQRVLTIVVSYGSSLVVGGDEPAGSRRVVA
jgi:hypothetical protein